jgi:hypothetical protein
MHRCLIGTDESCRHLTLPIVKKGFPAIKDVKIRRELMNDRWNVLLAVHGKAPFWSVVEKVIKPAWDDRHETLDSLNIALILALGRMIDVKTEFPVKHGMPAGTSATEKLQNICDEFQASVYVSGSGGRSYMDMGKMKTSTVFSEPVLPPPYRTVSIVSAISDLGIAKVKDILAASVRCMP